MSPPLMRQSSQPEWDPRRQGRRLLSLFVDVRDGEVAPLAHAFCAFFCILFAYNLLLPLRDDAGVSLGTNFLPTLFLMSLGAAVIAAPVAASFVSRPGLAKERAVSQLYYAVGSLLLVFYLLYTAASIGGNGAGSTGSAPGLESGREQVVQGEGMALGDSGKDDGAPVDRENPADGAGGSQGAEDAVRNGDAHMTMMGRSLRVCLFLWVGVQNLVALSTMWARCADIFTSDAGARLFGFIGAGGTLGQLAGSATARAVALRLAMGGQSGNQGAAGPPPYQLILLSSFFLFCTGWLASHLRGGQPHGGHKAKGIPQEGSGASGRSYVSRLWEGFALIAASPYLLHLCGYLVLNYSVASLFYFEKSLIVAMSVKDSNSRAAWFATVNMYSGAIIAVIQLTVTGRVIKYLGMPCSLAITPFICTLVQLLVSWSPIPDMIAGAEVGRKVLTYAISRPAREALFTVVSQEERYKAKICIDTVIQRLGDSAGAMIFQVVEGFLALGAHSVASWGSLACVAWCISAYTLGMKNQTLAAAAAAAAGG
ncbi:unnamed protein product [Ostreobium quekettii]|uniref:ADP,ATP carrier protein n=1 Tax=Ostreobium quekettii TaxID=121088 RepID=A0A8S1J7I1_9CHLO|nr:unnamed protein product [Ostreobium quekettii]